MKKTKIIALLLVAVMALGIFAACSDEPEVIDPNAPPKALKISEIIKPEDETKENEFDLPHKLYTSMEIYEELSGKDIISQSHSLVLYRTDDTEPAKYVVYNVENGVTVASFEVSKTKDILFDVHCVTVQTYGDDGVSLTSAVYNLNGEKIYETSGEYRPITYDMYSYYRIGNALYKSNYSNELVKLGELPPFFGADVNYFRYTGSGYAAVEEGRITYFDAEFNPVAEYAVPSSYDHSVIAILSNGNALISAFSKEDSFSEDYDFIEGTADKQEKISIEHFVFNPNDGTAKRANALDGYYFDGNLDNKLIYEDSTFGFYDIYQDGIINVLHTYKIENKRINTTAPVILNVDNDGTIKGQINAQITNQQFIPVSVGDYYSVSSPDTTYIMSSDGSVVKAFHSSEVKSYDFGFYDETAKIIYNKKLEPVKDLSGYTVHRMNYFGFDLCNLIYYSYNVDGSKNYYMWSEAGEKALTLGANEEIESINLLGGLQIYEVKVRNKTDDVYEYRYYNYQGTLLIASDIDYDVFWITQDFVIVCGDVFVDGKHEKFYKKIK